MAVGTIFLIIRDFPFSFFRRGGEGAAVVWKYTAQPNGKAPKFEVVEKYTGHERKVSCIHQGEFLTITGGKHIEIHRSPISHYGTFISLVY